MEEATLGGGATHGCGRLSCGDVRARLAADLESSDAVLCGSRDYGCELGVNLGNAPLSRNAAIFPNVPNFCSTAVASLTQYLLRYRETRFQELVQSGIPLQSRGRPATTLEESGSPIPRSHSCIAAERNRTGREGLRARAVLDAWLGCYFANALAGSPRSLDSLEAPVDLSVTVSQPPYANSGSQRCICREQKF